MVPLLEAGPPQTKGISFDVVSDGAVLSEYVAAGFASRRDVGIRRPAGTGAAGGPGTVGTAFDSDGIVDRLSFDEQRRCR